jgi:hypothetical protein
LMILKRWLRIRRRSRNTEPGTRKRNNTKKRG